MKTVDARGKNCPIPVIMAKTEIDNGNEEFVVEVDNTTAVQNLEKLAGSQGYTSSVGEADGSFQVHFKTSSGNVKPEVEAAATVSNKCNDWSIFVGKDYIGDGSQELGKSLMKMFFFTLSQSANIPKYVLFMNGGVKLPLLDEQVIEHLKILEDRGVEVLVCGTCVNFYNITEELEVGSISNMYDILQRMQTVSKVVSL